MGQFICHHFTSSISNNSDILSRSLGSLESVCSDGVRLFAVDELNHRILIWNIVPTADGASADLVVGQPNMTSRMAHASHVSIDGLTNPGGVRIVRRDTWLSSTVAPTG